LANFSDYLDEKEIITDFFEDIELIVNNHEVEESLDDVMDFLDDEIKTSNTLSDGSDVSTFLDDISALANDLDIQ